MFHKHKLKRPHFIYLFFIILLFGCSKTYDYTSDGPFITAYVSPAGPDDFRNLIGQHVAIYQDGKLILSDDEENPPDKPELEIQLEPEEVDLLKEIIEKEKFQHLKEDVSTDSEDGSYYNITVNFSDVSQEVQGWNPDNEQFNAIHDYVFSVIPDDDYTKWRTEIEEYIWEHNSLDKNKKNEYKENGPFFTLMMEQTIPGDGDTNMYNMQLSLDLAGNLLLFAEDNENKKMTEVRTLEIKLTDKEIEHFQHIILENFWKLNENQRNSENNLMETMTVYMIDEQKEVIGQEPDHPRYVKIKESIIDFIGKEEYEKWQSEIEAYLLENEKEQEELSIDELLEDYD